MDGQTGYADGMGGIAGYGEMVSGMTGRETVHPAEPVRAEGRSNGEKGQKFGSRSRFFRHHLEGKGYSDRSLMGGKLGVYRISVPDSCVAY